MKKLSNRTLFVSLLIFTSLALAAFAVLQSVERADKLEALDRARVLEGQKQYAETIGAIKTMVEQAEKPEDWQKVLERAKGLPPGAREHFTERANIGMLESLAALRDRLLVNAGDLYQANERDPDIKRTLEKAKEAHESAREYLDKISSENKDANWILALEYRRAYENYRSLAFLEKDEVSKALDAIETALANLQRANRAVPMDIKVEYGEEFLYKRHKEEEQKGGAGPRPEPGRPRAIPAQPNDQGTGGQDRLRRH